jgi:hypothetical protein
VGEPRECVTCGHTAGYHGAGFCNLPVGSGGNVRPCDCPGWNAARPSDEVTGLPTFEVGQVVGDLLPGRRRHDWCSMHGDIGPMESINAHALAAHGSSAEQIRKARKVLKRAALANTKEPT